MIHYKKDTDNIVTLTLDMKGRAENVINQKIWAAFVPVIEHLQLEKKRGQLRGVILTSSKKTFLAGGDLDYLYQVTDAEEIYQSAEGMKRFLRDLERPGVPVVAAINGNALGAGFEVALGCHHRIVVDDPAIRLGLPEVEIGLIPAGGSIIRLMWLRGIEQAYPILSSGKRYSPREALLAGIIDELAATPEEALQKAKTWLMETKEGRRPWDKPDRTIPGGTAKDPLVAARLRGMTAALLSQTHNNYPAPQAILNVLAEGSTVDFDTACRIESRYYTDLLRSRQCKNMIKAFWFDTNEIKAGNNRPKGFGKFRPKKVGIIGAGIMGSGIALSCLLNKLSVVLKDVSNPIADRGREFVERHLDQLVQQGQLLPAERQAMLARIQATDDARLFESCDLVIEAVFENQLVKQKVMREAEAYMDEYSFFATNTVSIPITRLAEASARSENYVGLHFFHPAAEVPLVEIVRGANTSEETIARAFDFVRAIHKIPIVVKDDWGFYVARVQNTYILEGITMLQEGYPPALIENLGRQAGMPKGPLALADDLGLELVLRYEQQAAAHYGPKYVQHPAVGVLNAMLSEWQRPGRQKRAGFYDYTADGERSLWPDLREHFPPVQTALDQPEIKDRFLFAQVLEAFWCLQEGVISSVPAANLGSIYGWGFPAYTGGVIQFVQDYGHEAFLHRSEAFRQRHGQRFKAPKVTREAEVGG